MKKTIKLFGFIALAALIGLSMATLSLTGCDEFFTNEASLNGAWKEESGGTSKGTIITIDGSDGFFTTVSGGWKESRDKGYITIGDLFIRNITPKENRTWSCQNQLHNSSTYEPSSWADGTLTLSADGNTLTKNTPSSATPVITYTRMQ